MRSGTSPLAWSFLVGSGCRWPARPSAGGHVEAEHHAALHVLGDVAVGHPQARVGHVEQDVYGLNRTHQHGVLPHQVGLGDPVAGQYQEPAGAVQVERVVHGMVGGHFIDQPDLDSVANGEPPVDGGAVGTSGPVQEPPVHGGARGLTVDLDHVVLPLDALCAPVLHAAVVHAGVIHAGVAYAGVVNAAVVHAAVVHACCVIHAGVIRTAVAAGGLVIGRRRTRRACREQLHAALGAVTRLIADHLWMHRACVGGHRDGLAGEQFHAALGTAAGLRACDV